MAAVAVGSSSVSRAATPSATSADYTFVSFDNYHTTAINSAGYVLLNRARGGAMDSAQLWHDGITQTVIPDDPSHGLNADRVFDISDSGLISGTLERGSTGSGLVPTTWTTSAPGAGSDLPPAANPVDYAGWTNSRGDVTGIGVVPMPLNEYATQSYLFPGGGSPVPIGNGFGPPSSGSDYTTVCGLSESGQIVARIYRSATSVNGIYLLPSADATPAMSTKLDFNPASCLAGSSHSMSRNGTLVGGRIRRNPDGSETTIGSTDFGATSVNDSGAAVGSIGGGVAGALVAGGVQTPLASLLPGGWTAMIPIEINNGGDIIGSCTASDNTTHGCLLKHNRAQPLSVAVAAFTPAGVKLDGQVASGDVVVVRVTVRNDGDTDLHNLQLAGGAPLIIDPRGTGTLTLLSGPTPSFDASTLPAHSARGYVYTLTAAVSGRAAAETKVSVDDPALGHLEAARSLRFDIAPADVVNPFDHALTKFLAINAVDQSLVGSFRSYYDQLSAKAAELAAKLRRGFSSADRKRWFGGDGSKMSVGPLDDARARQEASSGPMMAAQFPKASFHGYTADELQAEYDKTFKEETGKGVDRWIKGWKDLGRSTQQSLQSTWSETVLGARYVWGTATPEERLQLEAMESTMWAGVGSDLHSVYSTALREIPHSIDNLGYLMDAAETTYAQVVTFPVYVIHSFYQRQTELLPLADSDPLKYQRESAKLAADAVNEGLPVVLDTLIAGGATKLAVGGKAYLIAGKGAAVVETAEALGTLTDTGKLVKGATSSLLLDNSLLPQGLAAEESAALEAEGKFLERNPHATVVQSSDAGKVYSLPNLGGVPETTLDAKATILGDLEKDYAARTGKTIELAEVLKPGTPLAKPGGVAKVELTAPKTGKPVMVDAGMPEAALGEAQVWHNPVSPAKGNPDFANWAKPRQEEALQAWKDGNARFAEWEKPAPGSKDALMQECIGKLGRVPLDAQPVNGLQRFAVAEFEEKTVKQGTGEALLLRVKKYAVEVVDTERDVVVNRRTVVDSKTALPQTPDADSVAVGKVVGRDPSGQPIIAPLDRAEREFVMPRYVDKNVKLRRSGAVPDLAEHGTTLVMDDAGAKAAGSLLPKYGVPFLPEAVGRAYLARIAKFVAPAGVSADAMLTKMLAAVEASGGFGQHTIVVTTDSRFLGEVQFASW